MAAGDAQRRTECRCVDGQQVNRESPARGGEPRSGGEGGRRRFAVRRWSGEWSMSAQPTPVTRTGQDDGERGHRLAVAGFGSAGRVVARRREAVVASGQTARSRPRSRSASHGRVRAGQARRGRGHDRALGWRVASGRAGWRLPARPWPPRAIPVPPSSEPADGHRRPGVDTSASARDRPRRTCRREDVGGCRTGRQMSARRDPADDPLEARRGARAPTFPGAPPAGDRPRGSHAAAYSEALGGRPPRSRAPWLANDGVLGHQRRCAERQTFLTVLQGSLDNSFLAA
jgi:hypothetical protein